ncbi:hypothetical protein BDZ89DRAFT_815601 [Hymenopellis radicata]|nr:hypothetical protein BDZ89DRAFT_815601 [Hymenopellis radicata]
MATKWTLPDLMELSNVQLVAIARAQPHLWPHANGNTDTLTRLSLSHVKKETIARTLVNAGYERIPVPDVPNSLALQLHEISKVFLLVYLTDGINPNRIRRTIQRFPVLPEQRANCQRGTCRIPTEDLLTELSDWIDAYHGAGLPTTIRVGVPNAVRPEFIEYFAEGPAGLIYDAVVSFDTLTVQLSEGLQIVVEAQ